MQKKYLLFLILILAVLILPVFRVCAQKDGSSDEQPADPQVVTDQLAETAPATDESQVFKAKVIKILDEKQLQQRDGTMFTQQNLLVKGLQAEWKDKEIEIDGISDIQVISAATYKVGDNLLIQRTQDEYGNNFFNIQDFDREGYLMWLALIFCAIIFIVGRKKGFRALLSLVISFYIILKVILEPILNGGNPLWWGLVGSFLILLVIIYLTEGWNKKSHIAIFSVFCSLSVTLFLSWLFTNLTHLHGLVNEEAMFLIGLTKSPIDFQGLLLASILIGAVGVLDDVIVGQIEAVIQIKEANPSLSNAQVYKSAYKVGNTHLGAIVNTLFLTYAGASLPLLLLFAIHQEPFVSTSQILNNELIATEIVRTLVGSIGIALSMPIATFFAAYFLKIKK